jgi:hypothetical protein
LAQILYIALYYIWHEFLPSKPFEQVITNLAVGPDYMVQVGIALGFLDPDASISITVTDPTGEDIQSAGINYPFGNTIVGATTVHCCIIRKIVISVQNF